MVIAVNLQANTLILKEQVWEICPWRILNATATLRFARFFM